MYCVLMGDIIASRDRNNELISENTEVLNKIFDEINCYYNAEILSPIKIVRGDAFEGVLYSQYYGIDILNEIVKKAYQQCGIKFRACAVRGELALVDADSDTCNGPAFYEATKQLEKLKEKKSDHWYQISIYTGDSSQPLLDAIMNLMMQMTESWTDRQRDVVWAFDEVGEQKAASKLLDVAPSVVSKQLKAAHYSEYRLAIEKIKEYVKDREEQRIEDGTADYVTFYNVGRLHAQKYEYEKAITYFKEAIRLIAGSNMHVNRTVPMINGIIQSYIEMGDNEQDEKLRKTYLDEAEKNLNYLQDNYGNRTKIGYDYIHTQILRGNLYLVKEDWDSGLKTFQEAYQNSLTVFGDDNPLYDASVTGMASALKHKGDYERAIVYYLYSLDYSKKRAAINQLNYADSLFNLTAAQLLVDENSDLGNLEKAISIYRRYLSESNYALKDAVELYEKYSYKGV